MLLEAGVVVMGVVEMVTVVIVETVETVETVKTVKTVVIVVTEEIVLMYDWIRLVVVAMMVVLEVMGNVVVLQ